jgi:ABC-type sugar transport system ATPase subunit
MIELRNLTLRMGTFQLDEVSFKVEAGQYAVIMGKTGVGKTSILEAICGLRRVRSGQILIHGIDVTRWPPPDRNIGYMPQDLALFPTLSVREHLEFAMRLRQFRKEDINQRVVEISEFLDIAPLLERNVRALSGGEAQRVALGRALSFRPTLLLLDEPLSALDEQTRASAQAMLKQINVQLGVTVLHVTHHQGEADTLGDVCIRLDRRE